MNYLSHFKLMAQYNLRMNKQLIEAASMISHEQLTSDRGAYFGSILATLNHIIIADIIWLLRFAQHDKRYHSLLDLSDLPIPTKLDDTLYKDFALYSPVRSRIDNAILCWINDEVEESDFHKTLVYSDTRGQTSEREFSELVAHLFNHQTHHRGQLSTLFSQLGIDIGITDFLIDIPDAQLKN
ncbi:DinB family protein [Pseudoalteromonas luteoviolacea]|uniref:DinB family protein n=1 Tax=Pseudoalteromonas luteoviolacea TaxID=43657 RepID=UPI001B388142|nr:DinB family protein [Pseudoalteromonas luteoviolacea]MBQ4838508.1 damage-inducible protein DinB [Pseudoalteromonas luteoviolacea]